MSASALTRHGVSGSAQDFEPSSFVTCGCIIPLHWFAGGFVIYIRVCITISKVGKLSAKLARLYACLVQRIDITIVILAGPGAALSSSLWTCHSQLPQAFESSMNAGMSCDGFVMRKNHGRVQLYSFLIFIANVRRLSGNTMITLFSKPRFITVSNSYRAVTGTVLDPQLTVLNRGLCAPLDGRFRLQFIP